MKLVALLALFGIDTPKAIDDRLQIQLVASEPDIVTPTGLAIDPRGRAFVVESHTHFRPKNYDGPPRDRIRILEDFAPDGRARKITTFFEGTEATLNLAFGPTGELFGVTRSEVFVIPRAAQLGHADARKTIVRLETKAVYPHNGLSGFVVAGDRLWIGLGLNAGEAYRVIGSDESQCVGGGEGGGVFTCKIDGSDIRQVARGFWNPYAMCRDDRGNLFVVDNDPDQLPPCRLLHVVEGSDFGFIWRFGRNGLHPFHAWNGELPGTLPMIANTGEAPSGVLGYDRIASREASLPSDYDGTLLVTSWGDHRLERFRLERNGASYRSTLEPIITGGEQFRPVALDVAPDGSIYFSDWVDKSYELHRKGRVWRMSAQPIRTDHGTRSRARESTPVDSSKKLPPQDLASILLMLDKPDPFVRVEARRLLQADASFDLFKLIGDSTGSRRAELLLVARDRGLSLPHALMKQMLDDSDPTVRLVAVQWIGRSALREYRQDVEGMLVSNRPWTRRLFESVLATLEILETGKPSPEAGASFAVRFLEKEGIDPTLAKHAIRLIPADHPWLTAKRFKQLLEWNDERYAIEVIRTLRESTITERRSLLQNVADDPRHLENVREEARLGLVDVSDSSGEVQKEPGNFDPIKESERLMRLASLQGDVVAGERLFFSPIGPGCYRCHQVEGRGGLAGPDLTTIAVSHDPRRLIQSIVQPSAEIAPMSVPWQILTMDGRSRMGLLVREEVNGEQYYVGRDGKEFTVKPDEIEERQPSSMSIMPEGLLQRLSDEEVRDLLAFLQDRR